jgi:hypothetical protein
MFQLCVVVMYLVCDGPYDAVHYVDVMPDMWEVTRDYMGRLRGKIPKWYQRDNLIVTSDS